LPFFLGLMQHLASRGITCPQPIQNNKGEALGKIAGRPAAIITFLDGLWIRRPTAVHCAALGEALAKLHLAGLDFGRKRRNTLSVDGWRPLFELCRDRANEVQRNLHDLIEKELAALEREWPRDLPQGVIHADLFPDNVFFLGDKVSGLIDFYFACNDMLAYDVAVCLNAWCFESDGSFNITKARAMLQAYEGVRPLTKPELDRLPTLPAVPQRSC
jgi:homoserine kinase type II